MKYTITFLVGLLLGLLVAIALHDQLDCLLYPGTDYCVGCIDDCLDPME